MKQTVKPILVILAAGMGSRFGGLKQMTPVDDEGDFILDFSLFDAYRAGFRRVIFIIKPEMEEAFRETVGARISGHFEVRYAHQTADRLPQGYTVPEGREKPWGTAHAVACCGELIDAPFAVINADDFYGAGAFETIYRFLTENTDDTRYGIVGYRLRNTVSEFGSVSRGVCEVKDGFLTSVTERTKIFKDGNDAKYTEDGEHFTPISGSSLVSMNFWGFSPKIIDEINRRFPKFLDENLSKNPTKCEFYLPFLVDAQLHDGTASVQMLPCEETWYGVTYHEDLQAVHSALQQMKRDGKYPKWLWK